MRYLLDTSVWLRGALNPDTIPASISGLLGAPEEMFGLSIFSLWEVAKKNQKGKLPLPMDLPSWLNVAVPPNVKILPLTNDIIIEAARLPDFPVNDPADELIVATARVHRLTLLTTDTKLKNYRHARIQYFTPIVEKHRK